MNLFDEINGNYWWKAPRNDLYQELFAWVLALQQRQVYRTVDNLRYARLYGNYEMSGLNAANYTRIETSYAVVNRVTLNIIQSMIDTVVSKITKNKPKATFLTSGGDFSLQSKAKKLTKFVDGQFENMDFYSKAVLAFTDACIFGTGCIKFFIKNGQLYAERVFIEEIKVDDIECYYAQPRQLHQEKYIHKDVLQQMFPKFVQEIEVASHLGASGQQNSYTGNLKDMVRVVESWHLPSGPKAKDGKHCICTSNATLFEEGYYKEYFPFVFFRWNVRPVGFFGQGLAEQLQGLQLEINKTLRTIQVSMHLVSIPKLLVEASSKIVSSHLNNRIGGVIKYAGTPPTYAPLGGIPPELFSHVDNLLARAYEMAGISQLSAQSVKPAGLDSGKALRTFNDLETERFMSVAKRYEKTFLDAARIMIDLGKDIYEKNQDFDVKVSDGKFVETIKWKDVNMDADKYMMQIFPTSSLSTTPAARLADVQDMVQAGFIDKEQAISLLDFPDLESTMDLLTSDNKNLEKVIETMIHEGKYFPPEPYQNLENALRKVQQAYLMYRMRNAPEKRLELLRQYMEDCQALLMKAKVVEETPEQMAEKLAQMGASGAAEEEMKNAGEEQMIEEQLAAAPPPEEIIDEQSEEIVE
ncbi:MAG TPA: hypothetical protein DCS66_22950 [Flavobacteriaceae bacterium]|nr:hypothetical protein [Flavobacteriaceae bacterium]